MLKKKVWVIVAAVALVVGIFGWDTAVGYFNGITGSIKAAVAENTPTTMDVACIEKLLVKEAHKVEEFRDRVADLGDKIKGEKVKVVKIDKELVIQRDGLTKARVLIGQRKEVYFIGLRNRTLREVEHDAHARIKYVKTLEAQLTLSNTLIDTLTNTERNCLSTLAEANKNILAKHMELEQMKAREINAEIQAQANVLTSSLIGFGDSILNHSELQTAMDGYSKKISRKERAGGGVDMTDSPWIDYAEAKELPNLVHQIDMVLAVSTEVATPIRVATSTE